MQRFNTYPIRYFNIGACCQPCCQSFYRIQLRQFSKPLIMIRMHMRCNCQINLRYAVLQQIWFQYIFTYAIGKASSAVDQNIAVSIAYMNAVSLPHIDEDQIRTRHRGSSKNSTHQPQQYAGRHQQTDCFFLSAQPQYLARFR